MEKYFHKGSGIIKYDPYRGEMKRRTDWWCIVQVDKNITAYYRWWLLKERHLILHQPSWDAHISVVRGEKPRRDKVNLWKKYEGKRVDFLYEHGNIRSEIDKNNGGMYYWVDVECPFLNQIRAEFEYPIGWRMHITIGRTYY